MFPNVKTKKSPSKDNSSKSKLTLLTHDLIYEIEITIKKTKKNHKAQDLITKCQRKKNNFKKI
jgi:hypothetical protein